jgi:acyl dehydratase
MGDVPLTFVAVRIIFASGILCSPSRRHGMLALRGSGGCGMDSMRMIGGGFFWDDLKLGFRFRTRARTITEADLVNFVNLTWMNEGLFTDTAAEDGRAIKGRFVPGALVYAFAEGLLMPSIQGAGLAFLTAEIDIKAPTLVQDTIHVEIEVTELRLTSKGQRGLARTVNRVLNQRGELVLTYNPLRMLKRRTAA